MARLFSSGFELSSVTADVEFGGTGAGGGAISTSIVRSGNYSWHCAAAGPNGAMGADVYSSDTSGVILYLRAYVYFAAFNSGAITVRVLTFEQTAASPAGPSIIMDNSQVGALRLNNSAGTQIGSYSSALNLNQWYRIELSYDNSATKAVTAYINGVSFASGTDSAATAVSGIYFGVGGGSTSTDVYYDDIAINDNTGSFQNGLPGAGSIIHIHPNTNGDANAFATQTGGTAGSSFNYTRVNETPPDDATTLNGSNTLNQEDLFRLQQVYYSGNINVVSVGARFRNNSADATTALKIEAMKASGGTKSQSSAIVPNSATWKTNAISRPRLPTIVLYQDPDNVNWNQTSLNNMQIGYLCSTGGTNRVEFTNVWALIESTETISLKLPQQTQNKGLRPHPFSPGIPR